MIVEHNPDEVIRRLVRWAEERDPVRAMLLTSTRARPRAPVDLLSDYDVVLVVRDIRPFFEDRSWLKDFGEVLVAYWDEIEPEPDHGIEQTGNVVHYDDGLKIDFRLWPVALMRRIADSPELADELDAGYRVLLDKDSLTTGLRQPTYRAHVPTKPDEETYLTWVNDFFSDAPYVAKFLWRDELLPAKLVLDQDMKHKYLRRMLEWRMEGDNGWSQPTDWLGKGLKKRLPSDIWNALEATYTGAGIADNWEALFRTMALFRRVALEVADDLPGSCLSARPRQASHGLRARHWGPGSGVRVGHRTPRRTAFEGIRRKRLRTAPHPPTWFDVRPSAENPGRALPLGRATRHRRKGNRVRVLPGNT